MTINLQEHVIMGFDPGTLISGYGIISLQSPDYKCIDYGCIRPPKQYKLSDRYLIIYEGVITLIEQYKPSVLAIETQYVDKNVQSALKLGMARGIALIAAKQKGLAVFEYAPCEAKQAVVGTGKASKVQVQGMVQKILRLTQLPSPEDAADALAIAICHAHTAAHLKAAKEI